MLYISVVAAGLAAAAGVNAFPSPPVKRAQFDWDKTNFVLAFGDSYTFVQGTEGYPGYSFLGDQFNYAYTPQQLFSNQIEKNITSAGGPNWVEYLTGCYEGYPWKCKKQLWDFAFAGSDISVEFTPLHHNYSIDFVNQIAQWDQYGNKYLPVDKEKALVAVWIGINDISDSSKYAFNVTGANYTSLYTKMINAQFTALETLYKEGYHNYLVMGLPILEKTPAGQASAHPLPNKTMIANWDSILNAASAQFEAKHLDANVFNFDTYGFLDGVFTNATQYGFTITNKFCASYAAADIGWNYASYGCSPIYEYFWYNSGHITYHVHEIIAQGVDKFLKGKKR